MKHQQNAGFPLSPQQKHLWLLHQSGTGAPWRSQCAISIEGNLSLNALDSSLQKIVERHEILRTSFQRQPGLKIPFQVIADVSRPRLERVDLSGLEINEQRALIKELVKVEADRSFDFENDSPLRQSLVTLSRNRHLLIVTLPAICADAKTLRNLIRELVQFYESAPVEGEPMQYADFSQWQNELLAADDEEAQSGKAFWQEQNVSTPPGLLPFEGESGEESGSRSIEPDIALFSSRHVIPDLTLPQESDMAVQVRSMTAFLLACWQTLLWRLTGQSDFVVDAINDGRDYEELEAALGPYAKSLPLNSSFENDPRFGELVERVQESIDSAREWQAYFNPEESAGSHRQTSSIAFEVDEREPRQQVGDVAFAVERQYTCIDRFRLKLCCVVSENSFSTEFHYDAALFQPQTIKRIAGHFATLVESARINPNARVSELAVLSEAERRQLLVEFNETKSEYPADRCIHELFEEQVEKTPTVTAVVFEEQRLSYEELNGRANQVAHFLLQRGVGPGVKVGLCVDRSLEMIVGLLGILKAGAAYVPLSPEHPKARLLAQLTDVRSPVLLTQEKLLSQLPDFDGEVVCLDRDRAQFESLPITNAMADVSPQHLVYVIYTSGSTGMPKGVAVTHQNLVNYTDFICKRLNLVANDALQFGSVSTITADLGNTCIFPSLISGGSLHILSYETATDRARFADYFSRYPIDVLKIVPSHLSSLLNPPSPRIPGSQSLPRKYLILGGEALSWELAEQIRGINPDCELINHYGPTETTVGSLTYTTGRNGALAKVTSSVPIGRPIANTEVFIVDQYLNPVPVGVSGELYIGGAGVAQNYLNKPEQTAEQFISSPFAGHEAMRLYKTGDRARYLSDGNVEFMGRVDNQVKIRGYRVELGEVEATLSRHHGVRKVVVLAREIDEGNKQLVAYVVPPVDEAPTSSELRSFLKGLVPDYMIPTTFVFLKDLPLTRNGKVDRNALPLPDPSRPELQKIFVAPCNPTEELVAGIWAELLKLNRVGIRDNFFELGGHSLLATQVISRLRETFQVELPLSSLFETPTVGDLAQRIETARFASQEIIDKPISPGPRGPKPPLSFAQQRLWLLDQLEPDSFAYNVSRVVRAKGPLNYEAFKKSLDTLTARHETLRTTFDAVDGMPYQVIAETGFIPMRIVDLSDLPPVAREQEAEKLITRESQQPFDLGQGPLTRVTLIRFEKEHHILILNNHHIISDGWSAGILFEELALLYRSFSSDQTPQLPPLPVQYSDYAVWQREWLDGAVLEREVDYWKQQLDGAPALLELPTDRPRPAVLTHRGARERIQLPADLTEAIKTLSEREGVTLFMTFLATFQLLLSRHSGQDDIVVGSPIAGRTRAEIERLIGFFLNTLVLRTRLSGDPSFRELLKRVRDVALEGYAHQHLPFERLIEELQPARDLSHTPLFQVFLNVLNFSPIEIDLPGLTIEELKTPDIGSKFDLTLYAVEQKSGMTLELLYNPDLFDADRIVEMLQQFQFLLAQIVDRPDEKITRFSLVTPSSKQLLPHPKQALPATSRPPIHTLFSEQARRDPDQLAILDPKESWTYRELDYRSNQLANCLIASGVKVGNRVAIYGHRSAPLVWAVLGVLKAGAAFVILDPAYPVSRLISCLQVAEPRAWLQITAAGSVPNHLDEFLNTLSCCCRLELPASENNGTLLSQYPGNDPQVKVDSDDLALVAFTSGSTGTPKGILGRHGSLTLFAAWTQDMFGLNQSERFSMLSGLSHDPLQRDIFTPLQLGATISIPDPEDLADPPKLVRWFNEQKISVANLTPAMAQLLCETTWTTSPSQIRSLRYSFLIGDILTKHDVSRLKVLAPSVTCVNLYGSTETQRALSYFIVPPVPARLPAVDGRRPLQKEVLPLGRGIEEVELLLLNSAQQMTGIGEVGEIYFRSPHLAKGYLGDAVLTKERFLLNPFTKTPGDRLYRTGDLGRYLPDGNVEFLSRADRQVKIRGFRIELGEIEAALTAHPDVGQTIVIPREKDSTEKYLAAYLVPVHGSKVPITELRRYLKGKLPDYMVPSAFVMLEALPLTPNGKVDQAALPDPDHSRPNMEEGFVAPRTATEEKLASIWEAVLKVDCVGINDNFFELGGHSLLASQVIGRIRNSLQIDLPLRALFEAPTIKGLGEKLHSITATGGDGGLMSAITPVSRQTALPLSFAQQRLWFLNELEGESAFYNLSWAVRLRGELDVEALRAALRAIIERHETLRTSFTVIEGQPFQVISDGTNLAFSVTDLSDLPDVEDEAKKLATAEARQLFDLQTGPLIRGRLLRLSTDDHVLCVTSHHIVSDGWSIGIFVRELTTLYESFLSGRPHRLPELAIQYGDYAVWQRNWLQGEVLEQQLTYWKEHLRGAPAVLELPKDRPRPAVQTFHGAIKSIQLDAELTQALNELSRQEGVTLFMTLLAAFQVLLWRYSSQKDIVVGSPIAGRNQEEIEQLIGFFVNTLMLRTDLSGNPKFSELLERVKEVALKAYANQEVPFEKLVDELQPERSMSHAPLFQVMFVLQNAPRAEFKLQGLTLTRMWTETKTSKFDLTLYATESAGNLKLAFEYNTDLFDEARIDRMLEHFRILLEGVVRKPETRIGALRILPTDERERLLVDWNQTAAEFDTKCIHELFEEQVERTPEEIAVVAETGQLTYKELNRRANQLAHYLRQRGVGPEVLVGVCVERSLEMVVGLLGIMKAGGAYVPLDPAYPAERLRFMLEDSSASLLLTQQSLLPVIPESPAEVICLDSDWPEVSKENDENLATKSTAGNLAYVIYTSGSTGKPKGVAIEHRSAAALLDWARGVFSQEELSGVLASTSISFDLSVFELFVPLSFGGKVLLANDVLQLLSWALAKDVKLINTVPSAMVELLRLGGLPKCVQTVNLAGEPLRAGLVDKIYAQPQIKRVFDLYGPSEDTTYSTFALRVAGGPSTIGRPVSNTCVYLLDSSLQPVPVGVPGELYIGGAGLARGYLKRPELTANVFIPDPFSTEGGARLYKTGDLARYLEDGNIEYSGRIDNQIKLRGFRIELGEIEEVIKKHPQVSEALVLAREDEAGYRRLVAYVAPNRDAIESDLKQQPGQVSDWQAPSNDSPPAKAQRLEVDLKTVLIKQLPEYMRPSEFILLDVFPLTPNGKIDRSALPRPDHSRPELKGAYVTPRTDIEKVLAGIWADVLRREKVGVNDNFFELGGHSLLATQVISRIRAHLKLELPLRKMFESPTVAALATAVVEFQQKPKPAPVPAIRRR